MAQYHISDTHFGHENVLIFERPQFQTIDEHDDFIFRLIESTVKPDDTLIHHGDFGRLHEPIMERWDAINCEKILIKGNHDTQTGKLESIFDKVQNEPIFLKKRILLSHEPLPVAPDTINVHGHLHNSRLASPNHLNISIHMIDYKLLSSKDLERMLVSIPKMSEKFLYEWYADMYQFIDSASLQDLVLDENGIVNLDKSRIEHIKNDSYIGGILQTLPAEEQDLLINHIIGKRLRNEKVNKGVINNFLEGLDKS